ncbi:alpha/beta fold hydrolase [Nocardiopsis lambiniae]|uniref:Alpha/beta hydrolase n=1 Tax=Nocardiopsis lambiniae TaxID=3075539 RepID=A0ABU2MBE4_9ACTN|nr:alpha/beta hydrolase [Nocardiopsis sp. DSM 44743]MDT0329271.1 alpha/beta hydrolase [Nocardiopsis sp. DSM 44743]
MAWPPEPETPAEVRWTHIRGGPSTLRAGIVGTVEPGGDRPLVVATMGYRACVDDFEMQRFRLLSEALEWDIVVLDTPGYGYSQVRLDRRQRGALYRGDFRPLVEDMAEALTSLVPGLDRRAVSVLGYSLGACSAAALAGLLVERGDVAALDRMILVEPVAAHRWTLPALGLARLAESRAEEHYLDLNHRFGWAVPPTDRRSGPQSVLPRPASADLRAMIHGLSRGLLPRDLIALVRAVPGLRIETVVGESSAMVPAEGRDRLCRLLARAGGDHRVHGIAGAHHALWQSIEHVGVLARRLADIDQGTLPDDRSAEV